MTEGKGKRYFLLDYDGNAGREALSDIAYFEFNLIATSY